VQISIVDLREVNEPAKLAEALTLTGYEAERPFDLTAGPLIRVMVLRLGTEDHVLLLSTHHIISDGWSMGILIRELTELYECRIRSLPSPLPDLPIQYSDFARWQRSWLTGTILENQLKYWRNQLNRAPALLHLPTDRPRPSVRHMKGAVEYMLVDRGLTQ